MQISTRVQISTEHCTVSHSRKHTIVISNNKFPAEITDVLVKLWKAVDSCLSFFSVALGLWHSNDFLLSLTGNKCLFGLCFTKRLQFTDILGMVWTGSWGHAGASWLGWGQDFVTYLTLLKSLWNGFASVLWVIVLFWASPRTCQMTSGSSSALFSSLNWLDPDWHTPGF